MRGRPLSVESWDQCGEAISSCRGPRSWMPAASRNLFALAPVCGGEQLCQLLCHEGLQRRPSRTMAVRMVRSLCRHATMATLCSFPRALKAA